MEVTCQEQIYLGKVTQVIDPSNFCMQIGTDESLAEFLQFEINLEDSCCTMGISVECIDDIQMGQLVLVDCTDTNRMWRRGQVSRIDRGRETVDVLYIDYGDTELVNIDRLCVNQEDFFSYPSQALRCCLAGIKPIAKSWTSRATKIFQDMVSNEIFQTVVLAFQPGSFQVSLYTNHGDDGVAVSHMMQEQELGLPSDDEVPRLFADAPKHFNPDAFYSSGDFSNWGTPVMTEECKEEGAWPDSAPDQSSSSESPLSASYPTPQSGDNTDDDFRSKVQSHDSDNDDAEGDDSEDESQTPRETIPEFDFTQIERYWDTSTDKLHEKIKRKRHIELEAENTKLKEDMQEQSALTAAAGSGRFSILNYSSDEEGDSPLYQGKFVNTKFIDDIYDTNTSGALDESDRQVKGKKSPPLVLEGKKKKEHTYEVPPRFKKKDAGKSPKKNNCPPLPPGFKESSVKTASKEVYPNTLEYTALHWSGGSDHRTLGPRETLSNCKDLPSHRHDLVATLKLGASEQVIAPLVEDVEILGNGDGETIHMDQIAALEQMSPTKVCFYRVINQILAGANKEDFNLTAAKLKRLFSTDLFVYLDAEQLQDVVNILLNTAVQYYGELHNCLLEIIELLNVAQDFPECIVNGIKKLHDLYITVPEEGRTLHNQCSNIFGHLFNLSLFWNDSASCVQKCILDFVEWWMYFNKKRAQTGQEDLEQVYLQSFQTVWVIIADILKDRFADRYDKIQWKCRDKLLSSSTHRATKEQLLDLYINCFFIPSEKFTVAVECQTDPFEHRRHVGSQTDPQQKVQTSGSDSEPTAVQPANRSPRAPQHRPNDHSFSLMTTSLSATASKIGDSSVTGVTSPALASSEFASPKQPITRTPLFNTSADSSAYFTPDQSPFCVEFPPLDQYLNGNDDDVNEKKMTSLVDHIASQPDVESLPKKGGNKKRRNRPTDKLRGQGSPGESSDTQSKGANSGPKPSDRNIDISSLNNQKTVPSNSKEEKSQKSESKQPRKTTTKEDTAKFKRKEGQINKKGSFPLVRYGLATSVQNTPHATGQVDTPENATTVSSDVQKKLDMKSIMIDLMTSSDNTRNSEVTSDIQTRDSSDKTATENSSGKKVTKDSSNKKVMKDSWMKKSDKKSDCENKPVDWWSMDVNGSDGDCDNQTLDLGWPAHSSQHGEVLLSNVKSPITTSAVNLEVSRNSTAQEDDDDLEWETDNSDEEDDSELVAAILKRDSGNLKSFVKKPIKHEQPCWRPGVRKCTACGEESHTIYECPNKHKNAFF